MNQKKKRKKDKTGLKVTAMMIAFVLLAITLFFRATQDAASESVPEKAPVTPVEMVQSTASPEATPEPTPEPTPESEPEYFTISMVGDCTLWSNDNYAYHPAGYAGVVNGDPSYPFSNSIQYTGTDDYTLANLECILSDKKLTVDYTTATFAFLAPTDYASIMTAGGVDFVTIANNHIMDCYEKGLESTKTALEEHGLPYGAECQAQLVTTESGLTLGIYTAGVNMRPDWKTDTAVEAIRSLREQGAEYVICMFHWSDELYYSPFDYQVELAHTCIDAGADLIYGSHSHCLQPIEEYNGVPIFYSLGNWTFGGNTTPSDPDTVLVQLHLKRDIDGTVTTESYDTIPYCVSSNIEGAMKKSQNYNNYCPTPYPEDSEGYARVLSKLDGSFVPESQGADYTNWYASRAG